MKQYITPDDLSGLSDSQILNLRDLWMPEANTLAMARICKDVVNEEYDNIVFVIGEVIVQEGRRNLILRRMRLVDDPEVEQGIELEQEPYQDKEEFVFEYTEPEQYFGKDDCLPILNIGQLIEFLNRLKYGQGGMTISIPPVRKMIGDRGYTVTNINEYEFEEDELCDALWKALVEYL